MLMIAFVEREPSISIDKSLVVNLKAGLVDEETEVVATFVQFVRQP